MAFVLPFPLINKRNALVIPLGTSKRFVPLSSIRSSSGIILHEYFRRWSVVYYLAVLGHAGLRETVEEDEVEDLELHVIFPVSSLSTSIPVRWRVEADLVDIVNDVRQNTRPRFRVLLEVYYGLREILYDDYNDDK